MKTELDINRPLYWLSGYNIIYCHPNWSMDENGGIWIDKREATVVYPSEWDTTMSGYGIERDFHSNDLIEIIYHLIDKKRNTLNKMLRNIQPIIDELENLQQFLLQKKTYVDVVNGDCD